VAMCIQERTDGQGMSRSPSAARHEVTTSYLTAVKLLQDAHTTTCTQDPLPLLPSAPSSQVSTGRAVLLIRLAAPHTNIELRALRGVWSHARGESVVTLKGQATHGNGSIGRQANSKHGAAGMPAAQHTSGQPQCTPHNTKQGNGSEPELICSTPHLSVGSMRLFMKKSGQSGFAGCSAVLCSSRALTWLPSSCQWGAGREGTCEAGL